MPEKQYSPSPWTNPEAFKKTEFVAQPRRERTLREFIELKLADAGFAVDQHPEGILAWPRSGDPSLSSYVVGPKGANLFVVKQAKGSFNRLKTKKAMDGYLKSWSDMYAAGARD